eukprot:1577161-Rhodomonas_salina.1
MPLAPTILTWMSYSPSFFVFQIPKPPIVNSHRLDASRAHDLYQDVLVCSAIAHTLDADPPSSSFSTALSVVLIAASAHSVHRVQRAVVTS